MIGVWLGGDWDDLANLREAIAAGGSLAVVGGGNGELAGHASPDVVLHVVRGDALPRDEIAALREHTRAPIVLLATHPSQALLQEAVADGIADVLLLPQPPESIAFAAQKAVSSSRPRELPARGGSRVITLFSPKGGTGKSATACNLAAALAASGRRTLLVDLDLQFGDSAIMLGLEPERTLSDVVAAPGMLDAEKLAGYATRHESGLHVLPAPIRPEDGELVSDEKVGEVLQAAREGYDAVVVDTAPFLHGPVLATLDRTDELLLVCTPDVPTLKNVRLAVQTLELLSYPAERVRLVLNRASARIGFKAGEIAAVLERPVDVELPDDDVVAIGVNRGIPAVLHRPAAPYSAAVGALAAQLVGAGGQARPRRRRFALLRGRR